jgi:glycyl-tRNA synthetase
MNIEEVASYCKRRGIIFPTSEIYGQVPGFYDYGPAGVELSRNLKNHWWKTFVQDREDIIGIDGSIITNPLVWKASGHIDSFTDPLTECKKCHKRFRADNLIEEKTGKQTDGLKNPELTHMIIEGKIKCPECKSDLGEVKSFNQMLSTNVGPVEGNTAYLRPETAQSIFADYKSVMDSARIKPPFGIAQIGKAFRNEISPRNFIFRKREFEQMEIEFFTKADKKNDCPDYDKISQMRLKILSAEKQEKGMGNAEEMSINQAFGRKIFSNKWHAYFSAIFYSWLVDLGIDSAKLRIRQHMKNELSFYSAGTVDIEYEFPMGFKEVQGIADRTTYDLTQHQNLSRQNLEYFDEETKTKEILYVAAEPSIGVERLLLLVLFNGLKEEPERLVLKIHPIIAPYKVAVFPLIKKDLEPKAREVYKLLKGEFSSLYDEAGSIGKRYRRQDEIGTPYCITVDYDTLKDESVTLRMRDSMKQERIKITELIPKIKDYIKKGIV